MEILTNEQLSKLLRAYHVGQNKYEGKGPPLFGVEFRNLTFNSHELSNIKLRKCVFTNCTFDKLDIYGLNLSDCAFSNCSIQDSKVFDSTLEKCIFNELTAHTCDFAMCGLSQVSFVNIEFQYIDFSECELSDVKFEKGWYAVGRFEPSNYLPEVTINFFGISLSGVIFDHLNLSKSCFDKSGSGCSFVSCKLSRNTFVNPECEGISNIDFATIERSEDLPTNILTDIFGIQNPQIRNIIKNVTKKQMFYTVFISYSFKDKLYAEHLRRFFEKNNIGSFFWESDIPLGARLKHIMRQNVNEYEKFLFIASENSLKSAACHYELKIAREKYYSSWENVFIPILVDEYLFELKKSDIPEKFAKKYWENISQLKGVSAVKFSATQANTDQTNLMHEKLLETLKKI